MPVIFDDSNYHLLLRPTETEDGSPQCLPRRTKYGSPEAEAAGLRPLGDFPDLLIDPDEYKEVIASCHEEKIFALYHQAASGNFDAGWNQGSFGFCWSYGLTAATMDARALEGQEPVRLSPFSLGWLVNWKNQGYYLDGAIEGARNRGIAPLEYVPEHELNTRKFKTGWQEAALNYRPTEFFDTQRPSEAFMLQQALTILATGAPCYVAYNWWGHALELVALNWDEKQKHNVRWVLRNSHNETDVIELTGSKGVPDELYGVRATSLPK